MLRVPQVVGVTVMLTSMGVLFALVIVARLKLVNVHNAAHSSAVAMGPAAAFGAPPPLHAGSSLHASGSGNRLTMSFSGPAPLFTPAVRPDAAAFA